MAAVGRWIDGLCHGVAVTGIACLMAAIAIVVVDILFRRTLGWTVLGTVDLTQLCVMAAAFGSIPYAFLKDGHVRVELATTALPRRLRAGLDALAALGGALLLGGLAWLAWGQMLLRWDYGDRSQDLGIPMVIYWGLLIGGCGLSVLATLTVALRRLLEVRGGAGS